MLIQRATELGAKITVEMIKDLLDELDGKAVEWDTDKAETLCKEMIRKEDYIVFHYVNGAGKVVGLITIAETESLYAGGKIGLVQELYIVPTLRSKKLGRSLIKKAIDYARMRKWNRLEVGAPAYPEWARSKAFYIREGFKEVGPRLKYVL
ncbi:MAG TPA: GNAT family N-acetyltransferase [Phycisphaerales bacterium]|nr:GNAT family N-acetyltransferase [Phycisphaerales bacterium]